MLFIISRNYHRICCIFPDFINTSDGVMESLDLPLQWQQHLPTFITFHKLFSQHTSPQSVASSIRKKILSFSQRMIFYLNDILFSSLLSSVASSSKQGMLPTQNYFFLLLKCFSLLVSYSLETRSSLLNSSSKVSRWLFKTKKRKADKQAGTLFFPSSIDGDDVAHKMEINLI